MLAKSFFIFQFLLVAATASTAGAADLQSKSAHREAGVSYLAYKAYAQLMSQGQSPFSLNTPVDEAKAYGPNKNNLPAAPAWETAADMKSRFENFRDDRFLERNSKPGFLRRSSWLYPDDGCFARAALAVLKLAQLKYTVPKKVFVFGNLEVKTVNSPLGWVSWWYHVAPLVEVNGEKYVLDPAIEPKNPLRLEEWLARMSPDPDSLEVAVCGSGSYTPYEACDKETDGVESLALSEEGYFLDAEWSRLEELGRNPEEELGDLPPWLRSVKLP